MEGGEATVMGAVVDVTDDEAPPVPVVELTGTGTVPCPAGSEVDAAETPGVDRDPHAATAEDRSASPTTMQVPARENLSIRTG